MDIQIRLEQPADYSETEQVIREAFWNHYSPGCTEHYLLHVMRNSPNFVPELDFVAVANKKIIGSVVFMKSFILGDDGKRYDVLTLGPIAVLPVFQSNMPALPPKTQATAPFCSVVTHGIMKKSALQQQSVLTFAPPKTNISLPCTPTHSIQMP